MNLISNSTVEDIYFRGKLENQTNMAKPFPTDHSIMKLAVAAEQHRKMNMAASSSAGTNKVLTNPSVVIKKEEILLRKPVIESTKASPRGGYQGSNLITTQKAGSKRKKYVLFLDNSGFRKMV